MTGDRRDPTELLIEAALSPFREQDATGRILPHPAWFDLAPEQRERLFEAQMESRALERLMREDGMSATARMVAARLAGVAQLGG